MLCGTLVLNYAVSVAWCSDWQNLTWFVARTRILSVDIDLWGT